MRYKIGDKVRIKTWKKMCEEYSLTFHDNKPWGINSGGINFLVAMEEWLIERGSRVVTINIADYDRYRMEGIGWGWTDEMIEGEETVKEKIDSIETRFEILDL